MDIDARSLRGKIPIQIALLYTDAYVVERAFVFGKIVLFVYSIRIRCAVRNSVVGQQMYNVYHPDNGITRGTFELSPTPTTNMAWRFEMKLTDSGSNREVYLSWVLNIFRMLY